MKFAYFLWIASAVFISSSALADPALIQFTDQELNAAVVLIRPELNQISINGKTGIFTPSPALRFFGVTDESFQIDFSSVINLADIEFNQLKTNTPQLQFQKDGLTLNLPVNDQVAAIRSRLGSINLQNVTLTAKLGWQAQANGVQNLVVQNVIFNGNMSGTGLLKPPFILTAVKKLLINVIDQQVSSLLARPIVQESVQKGLMGWAKFYTGTAYPEIVPNSVKYFTSGTTTGLQYEAQ